MSDSTQNTVPNSMPDSTQDSVPSSIPSAIIDNRIEALRKQLGQKLTIMGHHYQQDTIMQHVDKAGDSLQLAQMMEHIDSEHIIFCGVDFMAESAALLAREGQNVYLPALSASCSMADMVPADLLDIVLEKIVKMGKKIIPLAYVNTSLAVKTVVGKYGGAVCTSSNAKIMMEWARSQGDCVLFLPDMNLGQNTANALKLPKKGRHILDVSDNGANLDKDSIEKSYLLFWPGYCRIHHELDPKFVLDMRQKYPEAKIYVHPESRPETVDLCDGSGSTSYLIKKAKEAKKGDILIIGTEINLVYRVAKERKDDGVHIEALDDHALCPDMAKITPKRLCANLEAILDGSATPVRIDASLVKYARLSIIRMLEQCT